MLSRRVRDVLVQQLQVDRHPSLLRMNHCRFLQLLEVLSFPSYYHEWMLHFVRCAFFQLMKLPYVFTALFCRFVELR